MTKPRWGFRGHRKDTLPSLIMKTFTTLFEKTENVHLIKDVRQIPYLMNRYFGYDATVVTYKNSSTYPYLEHEVAGLKLKFIPKIKLGRYSLSALAYLFFNAKKSMSCIFFIIEKKLI